MSTLGQAKYGIYTHLAQFQTHCWKHWDISVPLSIFEKKEAESRRERERLNAQVTGWWGPAKGVPLMVFILTKIPIPNVENTNRSHLPVFMKKLQESLQAKMRHLLRSIRLIPIPSDNNASHNNLEFKSLFCLPQDQFPFLHMIPEIPSTLRSDDQEQQYSFEDPSQLDIDTYLSKIDYFADTITQSDTINQLQDSSITTVKSNGKRNNKIQVANMLEDYGNKLLCQFISHWIKTAKSRNPMHLQVLSQASNRRHEVKQTNVPLPTALQFFSALVPLLSLIYGHRYGDDAKHDDFRKQIMTDNRSTKGMVQQIEVILRKKIKNTVEVERVFSRSHSQAIMQKCIDAYIQDSPPYYTQQYHLLKSQNVLRLYNSLSRGPSALEFATRLERECEIIWKQGRQSCEAISLTGKVCRLKDGHDKVEESKDEEDDNHKTVTRDDRLLITDTKAHSSGYSFNHACTCGRSRKIREDPFDIEVANYWFYEKFACCLADEHKAIDLDASTFGIQQQLVYNEDTLPHSDAVLLYIGPASAYRNTVGLERYEGYTENTNYLLPWNLTTVSELEAKAAKSEPSITNKEVTEQKRNTTASKNEWPALGKNVEVPISKPPVTATAVSMESFPSLHTTKTAPIVPNLKSIATTTPSKSSKDERRKERRRRDGKRSYRLEGQIRGFLGAEYECPQGHRFLSCGDGRVCKLGHKGHPKGHGNHFIHQDLPLYALCPCNFADYGHNKMNPDKLAQLQRFYVVTPDANVEITMKPNIKIKLPDTDESVDYDLGIDAPLILPRNGIYVLRLPFIYRDIKTNQALPLEMDIEKRMKNAYIEKGCFEVHF
ncbi:uncharacterized protein BX664DRAFT_254105 [Halteromyces radiatus]|uniref:uncharacterized protein n=1 Tax=Halteromyces radiatus TaxID=101107 RepID=UPI00221FF82B|nr:uncharacterized protein BX664DRAFT_254105 [Halteromyces radiatus]KAI8099957.1 hypothetical protein BX664DRAFT_254105 [Halteromyces radiatus]